MDVSVDICCLCLKEPLINEPLVSLDCSRPTYLEKLTSTLSKLAQVLNDLKDCDFRICKLCAGSIEMVYSFNSKWLDNVRIYSLRGVLKAKRDNRQCDELETNVIFEQSDREDAETMKTKANVLLGSNDKNVGADDKIECLEIASEVSNQEKETSMYQTKEDSPKVVLNCKSWYIQEAISRTKENAPTSTKKVYISLLKKKGQQNNTVEEKILPKLQPKQDFTAVEEIITGKSSIKSGTDRSEESNSNKKTYVVLLKTDGKLLSSDDKTTIHLPKADSTKAIFDNKFNIQESFQKTSPFAFKTGALSLQKKVQQPKDANTKEKIQKIFSCYHCGQSFRKKGSLREHERIHTDGKPYTCEVCGKSFRRPQHLRGHMLVHTDLKPYECTVCKRLFRQKCLLNTHLLTHREGFKKPSEMPKRFICEKCGKGFYQKIHLINHRLVHSDYRAYSCEICGKQFKRINNLNIHKRVHTEERPYSCTICSKTFKCKTSLNSHNLVHTGGKSYPCNMCEKTFPRRSTLAYHKKTHTGLKPHECSVCNKAFIKKYELERHIVIHTNEKPFVCALCDKGFALNSSLVRHIRIHTGERPYECELCDKTYTKLSHLKRHKIKIHNLQ